MDHKRVGVTDIVDQEGWCKSIYFKDPNGIQLDYCCLILELTADDTPMQVRFEISSRGRRG